MTTLSVPLMAVISVPRGWRLGLPFIGALAAGWVTESMPIIGSAAFAVAILFAWVQLPVISKAQTRLVGLGTILAILMFIGAVGQAWNPLDGSDHLTVSFGFAALFMLSVLAAGMPRAVLLSGFQIMRYAGILGSIYAWIAMTWVGRVYGPVHLNPNAFAGFLAFTAMQWLVLQERITARHALIAGFLFSGIVFTGSRWALLISGLAVLLLFVWRKLPLHGAIIIGACVILAIWAATAPASSVLRVGVVSAPTSPTEVVPVAAATAVKTVTMAAVSAKSRLAVPVTPGFMPRGYLGGKLNGNTMHSIYQRAAVETGWIGLGLFLTALWSALRSGNKQHRLLLLFLAALGIMDFYTWIGVQLVPVLWATMAIAVTDRQNLSAEEPV